jgi:hypothetical protein
VGPVVACVVGGALNLAAALVGGRLALALSLPALALPFLVDAPAAFRQVHSELLALQAIRGIEIARYPNRWGRGERLARLALLYETDAMTRVPRAVPWRMLGTGVALAALSVAGLFLAARAAPPTTPYAPAGWPRWLVVAAFGYFFLEGYGRIWTASPRLLGWAHPPLQRAPILSRSLAEFWGVRWNFVVCRMLKRNAFDPLARRRAPRLGVLAAFAMSAALHGFMTLAAVGARAAAWMASFFLMHGVASLVEAGLGVRRWPPPLARAFVIAVFVLSLPPFAEAFLRGFGL